MEHQKDYHQASLDSCEMEEEEDRVHKFKLPKNILCVGSTQSGKSYWCNKLLLNGDALFEPKPERYIVCYSEWQPCYDELQNELGSLVTFRTDIPTKQELSDMYRENPVHTILLIDDKMSSFRNDAQGRSLIDIVCVQAHHCLISCIILVQNIFHSPVLREISLNCHYHILFRNNRSYSQIRALGTQVAPRCLNYFLDAYEKATCKAYGYLVLDLCPDTPERFKFKTNIFPDQDLIVFLPTR